MEEEKQLEWREIYINPSNINILFLHFYLKYVAASNIGIFNQNYDRFLLIFCTYFQIVRTTFL